jgi:hypothetical protein
MNDPHVDVLYYAIQPAEGVDYDRAPELSGQTDDFEYTLTTGGARFRMKKHFATEDDAKKVVDQFLQAWSIYASMNSASDEMTFHFTSAEIIDRQPASKEEQSDSISVVVTGSIRCSSHISVSLSHLRGRFPSPPQRFVVPPDVETMYVRYQAYRQKRETLLSMAYMCLTVLEASTGPSVKNRREMTGKKYFIDKRVLGTLGRLVSEKGDVSEVRKMPETGSLTPLTENEKQWIEEVLKKMILRAGEYGYDPTSSLPLITMNDFPTLP